MITVAVTFLVLTPAAMQGQSPAQSLPPFKVRTLGNLELTPKALAARPHVIFFFCPCGDCRRVATGWAGLQSRKAFSGPEFLMKNREPGSIVVFSGSPTETKMFINGSGMSVVHGIADPDFGLAKIFRAMPCPTIFVTDGQGTVRYASKEGAGELQSDAGILLGQTIESLRAISGVPVATSVKQAVRPQTSAKLTIVPSDGQLLDDGGTLTDRWLLKPNDETVSREFKWTNKTREPIEIEQLLTSCGCERATMVYRDQIVQQAQIAPNETLTVRIEFQMPASTHSKSVTAWLFAKAVEPVATIRVEAVRQQ